MMELATGNLKPLKVKLQHFKVNHGNSKLVAISSYQNVKLSFSGVSDSFSH